MSDMMYMCTDEAGKMEVNKIAEIATHRCTARSYCASTSRLAGAL